MASDLYLAGVSQMDGPEAIAGFRDSEACLSNPFFIEAQPSIGTVVTE
jgi:hypothetical protein